jgi:hypothetical protein
MAALPDIGWAATTMCLRIADTAPTAAANDVARRYVGHRDGWQRTCDTGRKLFGYHVVLLAVACEMRLPKGS